MFYICFRRGKRHAHMEYATKTGKQLGLFVAIGSALVVTQTALNAAESYRKMRSRGEAIPFDIHKLPLKLLLYQAAFQDTVMILPVVAAQGLFRKLVR